jgi:hypothetical protein
LLLVETRVEPVAREQLLVRAALGDAPAVEVNAIASSFL